MRIGVPFPAAALRPALLWLLLLAIGVSDLALADGDKEVITAEIIEREKPASLMELLRKRVGLGDAGGALSLRGVPKVALYVDGFPRQGVVLELEKIKPQDVLEIDILRGAASARFGADALGGALVITTKQGRKRWSFDIVQGYNSFDSRYSRAIASGTAGLLEFRGSFEDSLTNKFINQRSDSPIPSLVQVQDAYFGKRGGDFKAGYRNEWLTAGVELNYLEQIRNFGRPNNFNEYTTVRPKLLMEANLDSFKLSANLMYEETRVDVFRDGGGLGAQGLALFLEGPETERILNMELQASYKAFNAGVVYGLTKEAVKQRQAATGQPLFSLEDTVERIGVFGAYGFDFWTDWHVDLSGRYDRYDYYDVSVFDAGRLTQEPATTKESFNPKLSLVWRALPWLAFQTSAATGFMPPNTASLYFRQERPSYRIVPNPALKPEQSLTVDFGTEVKWKSTQVGLTLFYTRWTDKIERLTTPGTLAVQTSVNLGESESKGVELSFNQTLFEGIDLALNYTLTFTEITRSLDLSIVGNELPFQPRHRLNAVLTYQGVRDLTARLNLHYESAQFMDFRNIERDDRGFSWLNDDYATVDFLITKKFGLWKTGIDLTFAINNLFDNRYEHSFFQRDPGRMIRGEISVHF